MFDQFLTSPSALARHRMGPLSKERLAFLMHLAKQGYARSTLQRTASELVVIVKILGMAHRPREATTCDEVQSQMANHQHLFRPAIRWLLFLGRLHQQPAPVTPWAKRIRAFASDMEHQQGLQPETIRSRCSIITRYLNHLDIKSDSLHKITPGLIDVAFQKLLDSSDCSRKTVRSYAYALRAFFRFAGALGWCRKGLDESIRGPRVFSQAALPLGPSWDDVQRLLAMTEGNQPRLIRARPILMLLAIYGLRRGEVSRLRLDDFDWEHEVFRVVSSKTAQVRSYPLLRSVGDAILRYLQEVRPQSSHRELFLSMRAPFRPVCSSLWALVGLRLRSLHVSLPHYGPHALRHACATRLLGAGLSLKEIGDQLGHMNPDSTRIYAKVDLIGLRQVADFDMRGVL